MFIIIKTQTYSFLIPRFHVLNTEMKIDMEYTRHIKLSRFRDIPLWKIKSLSGEETCWFLNDYIYKKKGTLVINHKKATRMNF